MAVAHEQHMVDEALLELGARPEDLQPGTFLAKVVEKGDPDISDHEVYVRLVELFQDVTGRLTEGREMTSHDRDTLVLNRLESTRTVASLQRMVDQIRAELDARK